MQLTEKQLQLLGEWIDARISLAIDMALGRDTFHSQIGLQEVEKVIKQELCSK